MSKIQYKSLTEEGSKIQDWWSYNSMASKILNLVDKPAANKVSQLVQNRWQTNNLDGVVLDSNCTFREDSRLLKGKNIDNAKFARDKLEED